jgi:hypothetical protein
LVGYGANEVSTMTGTVAAGSKMQRQVLLKPIKNSPDVWPTIATC